MNITETNSQIQRTNQRLLVGGKNGGGRGNIGEEEEEVQTTNYKRNKTPKG